ncbi:hypothetical protein [Peribacillus sp. NPDC097895]|uniref:hypothetical protein n=1 Tax=Peribacillus sp. NPDC097895 TaxID=3390619 RepID=UPI003CFF2DDA
MSKIYLPDIPIIDPWGVIVSEAGEENELLTGTLDFKKVLEGRNKIPVFEDRHPDYYYFPH